MPTRSQMQAPKAWRPPVGSAQEQALAYVAARSVGAGVDPTLRVTLNFHPDRLHRGVPILQALGADGVYRSQFETGTSNGGQTAHPGGDRWEWESRLFGRAYDTAAPSERPKYGALNFRRRATGGSPRFGSAHLRLKPDVCLRSTFCYPDSVFAPAHFGVASRMHLLALAEADDRDALDDYIEALEEALGRKAERNLLPMQPGDVLATSADTTELDNWVGFKPNTPVKEGVRRFVEWYREYYKT